MAETTIPIMFPIAAVERDTGLGKDTLRVWERRYGFPQPVRDVNGERQYPADQVARLRSVKRLIDQGHRPGKLLAMSGDELDELSRRAFEGDGPWSRGTLNDELIGYLENCRLDRAGALRASLVQTLARLGLRRFVLDVAAPLLVAVGDCWERGEFQVYEEHLFTEVLQNVLRVGIAGIPWPANGGPVIILGTFPQELHTVGLLMAEALFALEGAHCISLGASTPVADIARAAAHADVVALSFPVGTHTGNMLSGLSELAALLPPDVQLWCGGAAASLARCHLPSFRHVELANAGDQVRAWREQRRAATGAHAGQDR